MSALAKPSWRIALSSACISLLALSALAPAWPQLRGLAQGRLAVYYEPRDELFAKTALEAATAALPTLAASLGIDPDKMPPVTLLVTREDRVFDRYVGKKTPPWIQGIALPGRRIVLRTLAPPVMRTTAVHELTHVLFDELAQRYQADPPRWLHEGLAKLAANDFTQTEREILGRAVLEGRLLSLAELETAFSGPPERVSLAYAQAYTLVRFLHEQKPSSGLQTLLENLGLTHDLQRALLRTYGLPATELEKRWLAEISHEYLRHGLPLPGDLVILLAMGVFFLAAYVVQSHRRRLLRKRLQEAERQRRIYDWPAPRNGPHNAANEYEEGEEEEWP